MCASIIGTGPEAAFEAGAARERGNAAAGRRRAAAPALNAANFKTSRRCMGSPKQSAGAVNAFAPPNIHSPTYVSPDQPVPAVSTVEAICADRRAHRLIAKDALTRSISTCTSRHQQRNQVLLARMCITCERRFTPPRQQSIASSGRCLHGLRQPPIEGPCPLQGLRLKISAQVMEANPASHNQHALVAQRDRKSVV